MATRLHLIILSFLLLPMADGTIAQTGPIIDNFNISKSGDQVLLNWRMLAGNTCNGITIFRATDTLYFSQIGHIPGICGSTIESVRYTHADLSPEKNSRNYYRLEFGGVGVSEIISIDIIDVGPKGYQVRPNPVHSEAKIFFRNDNGFKHQLRVYSMNGIEVYTGSTDEEYFSIQSTDLEAGLYMFTISTSGALPVLTGKLLVQPY
jgi:hypothetical protein